VASPEQYYLYSTDQKKPNRNQVCEQERNEYRMGMREWTEREQNGYRTDIIVEQKRDKFMERRGTETECVLSRVPC